MSTIDLKTEPLAESDLLTDDSVVFGAVGGQSDTRPEPISLLALRRAVAGLAWRGAWVTATEYAKGDTVENDGSGYICLLAHTSGPSNEPGVGVDTDTYWDLFAAKGDAGASAASDVSFAPAGNLASTNVQAALQELDTEKQPLDAALTALAALTTTAFGRALLEQSSQSVLQLYAGLRRRMTGDETFYVRVDGSDANNGSANTAGAAFASRQGAWDYIAAWIDPARYVVTIQFAAGTYSGSLRDLGKPIAAKVILLGDTGTPSNVFFNDTSDDCVEISTGYVEVRGAKMANSGGSALHAYRNGIILASAVEFGTCSEFHNFCDNQGQIVLVNYTVNGSAPVHWYAHTGGYINCITRTITFTGTPDFDSGFARAHAGGIIEAVDNTYSGAITGLRFVITGGGIIYTGTNDLTTLPGSLPGIFQSGYHTNDAAISSINTGPLAGFRNAVINGSMSVAQAGTSFTDSGTKNNDTNYTLDQWRLLSDGNDIVDVSQDTADVPTNGLYACKMLVATVNKKFGIFQAIEQRNCIGLIGNQVTLSFKAKVNNTTRLDKIKCALISWDGTADTLTADPVSSWGADGVTPTLAANFTIENSPSDLGVTTSWASYSVFANIDTAAAKNICIFIWSDNVTDTDANDVLSVTDVQLEIGINATPFERRPFGVELSMCQRYYWKSFPYATTPADNAGVSGAIAAFPAQSGVFQPFASASFLAQMRATPTITLFNFGAGTAGQWYDGATVSAGARATTITDKKFNLDNTGTTLANSGSPYYIHAVATARL